MKKTIIILFCSSLAVACGNSSDNSSAAKKDSSATTNTSVSSAENEKGLELIGSSDCTTCHRLHTEDAGSVIGPAYSQVAAKYAPAADSTVNRLVKKIITGGTGVWGQVPMTGHPLLPEADVREMVKYILSLKK